MRLIICRDLIAFFTTVNSFVRAGIYDTEITYRGDLADVLGSLVVPANHKRRAGAVVEGHVVSDKVGGIPVVPGNGPVIASLRHDAMLPLRQGEGVGGQILVIGEVAGVALEREVQLQEEILAILDAVGILCGTAERVLVVADGVPGPELAGCLACQNGQNDQALEGGHVEMMRVGLT